MDWAAELYVHAIAVESEAAQRYSELARRMAEQHNDEAAALFAEFAAMEAIHLEALRRRTEGMALPLLTSDHSWPEQGVPLANALQAEKDARAFFEHERRIAHEPAARALAEEMVSEESEHIARLARLGDTLDEAGVRAELLDAAVGT
jgi:rubrerythrin